MLSPKGYKVQSSQRFPTEIPRIGEPSQRSREQKRKVETVPLTIAEGLWLNEFLYSPQIIKTLSDSIGCTVLLSDISSEVSDSPKEQNIIKFSWKYSEPINWRVYDDALRIFSKEYSNAFS